MKRNNISILSAIKPASKKIKFPRLDLTLVLQFIATILFTSILLFINFFFIKEINNDITPVTIILIINIILLPIVSVFWYEFIIELKKLSTNPR
ncbi:hypothetical protein AMD27_17720 (plasmid) [Acinetobacter sp. TGL-Y2]|uniref:hypothetical protein n=1 Tax=Acinetobacter sp. TGL-Y2 TaxID=1407071 RepID=UPI0007A6641F|nr:hypothetical protein [Acinetobacter sp. TGL-Y2]AMW80755.1 hypothetical protein AMD27_17720 [Acinetobacter sp. TGL-Y2]